MTETSALLPTTADPQDISIVSELMYQLKVRDVMTRTLYTTTPANTLRDVQHIMRDRKISGVPVVENTRLVGIVSLDDIIRALDRGEIEQSVAEKMTRHVFTVEEHVSVVKAIDEMEKTGCGRLPVLNKTGALVGLITHWDVVRTLLEMLQEVAMQAEKRERTLQPTDAQRDAAQNATVLDYTVDKDDFENAGRAASAVKKYLQSRSVDPALIRRVAVAMYEAEINIIIHSLGGRMTARVYPDHIHVSAIDTGPGIADIALAMKEGWSTATEKVREMGFGAGMGLANIKRCADRFQIESCLGKHTELSYEVDFTAKPAASVEH